MSGITVASVCVKFSIYVVDRWAGAQGIIRFLSERTKRENGRKKKMTEKMPQITKKSQHIEVRESQLAQMQCSFVLFAIQKAHCKQKAPYACKHIID